MHHELVLINQSQLRQRQRELYASREQSLTRLLFELLHGLLQIPAHQEPDIIAIENAASIHGGGPYHPGVGIASDPDVLKSLIQVNGSLQDLAGPRGGWQFLISTSQHAEAARRLALRAPDCDVLFAAQTPVPPELQKAALEIADAYLRTPTEMKDYNDADRLTTEGAR